jgi:TM2 domain
MSTPDGDVNQPPPPPPGYQAAPPPGYYYPAGYAIPQPGAPWGVDQYGRPYSDKNKVVAGVLQLVLGTVGAGRWYTGHHGIALAQLLTCGGFGVWALIDGIMMLAGSVTDPQGRPLHG